MIFFIVALEGKRPEAEHDRKGKTKVERVSETKKKERRGIAQQKKRERTK
jgi:hypothetical protein